MRSRRGTRSTAASSITTTPASTENVKVYLVIAVSIRIDIVYKWVTEIVKDVWATDCWLNKFKNSLSEIKDGLAFIRRGITTLTYNARYRI